MAEPSQVDLVLSYPHSWCKPPQPQQYDEPEREMTAWLEGLGLLATPEARSSMEKLRSGYCVATSYVDAVPPRLVTVAKFYGLWVLYEDSTEGTIITGETIAAVADAVAGNLERPASASGAMRGWWETGQEFRRSMGPAWCQRFGRRFASWQHSVIDESRLFARYGRHPDITEYYLVRHRTMGMHTWTDLMEYALGRELPPECFTDLDFIDLTRIIVDVPFIQNELFGLTKDREKDWPNFAFTTTDSRHFQEIDVLRQLARIHDILIERFLVLERRLRDGPLPIGWWLDGAHHILAGMALWFRASPRYAPEHRLADGTAVRLSIEWSEQADETLATAP